MTQIRIDGPDLVVTLTPVQKLLAMHGDVRVALSVIAQASLEPHPWQALRGIRAPGTGFPGVIAYGVRRHRDGQDFTLLLGRLPVVRVDLHPGAPFARLLISTRQPQETLATITTHPPEVAPTP